MTLPYSTRLTVPLTISPMRSLYSSYWRSRSASRTFCTITCLADCAAMRPKSIGGSCSAMKSPTCASGLRARASLQRYLLGEVLDGLDDLHQALQLHLAGVGVDVGADVGLLAVAGARRLLDRVGHRRDDDLLVDRLLARDRIGDLQKLQPVGTDYHFRLPEPGGMPPGQKINCPVSVSVSSAAAFGTRAASCVPARTFLSCRSAVADEVVGQHQPGLGDSLEGNVRGRLLAFGRRIALDRARRPRRRRRWCRGSACGRRPGSTSRA